MKVLVIVTVCALCVSGKVAPDDFPQCKRSDPHIDKCILDAIEVLRPRLKTGIPEVGVPALEPFVVPTLKLDRTAPNLRLKAIIKNMKALGGSRFKVDKIRLNLNNKYVGEVRLTIPKLLVWCDYDVRGSRLLTLDINGKGKLRGNFTGINVTAKGIAKPLDKEGVEYLHAEKVVLKVRIGHGQVAFDDTERPLAATSAATFFNASPGVVLDILSPLIEETGAAILKTFLNKVLGSIPLKEILIDSKTALCHYSDPHVEDCIKRLAEQAKHVLAAGLPNLGIQPLEPLKVPSIRLRQHNGPTNGFKYDAWLSDVMVGGLTDFSFNKLDVYPEELKVTANVSLPRLELTGDYVVIGKFQMLPVESTGKMKANFTECTAALEALGARVHKRMVIRDAIVHLQCSGAPQAELDEARSTTGEMEMVTEHIVRMHSQELTKEVQPAVETALAMVLEDVANKMLKHLPADSVFPN